MIDIAGLERQILGGLKDFQRATVERVHALFTGGRNRVLVADEVGLGKTLIAKGVIAKMAHHHRERLNDDLFKVVYICSNQSIAGQNLAKLKIHDTDRVESLSDTRLSMQHLRIFEEEANARRRNHNIQLIPLTPQTSFSMTGGGGSVGERALIYAILSRYPPLASYRNELERILRHNAYKSWDHWVKDAFEKRVADCERLTNGSYLKRMLAEVDRRFSSQPDEWTQLVEHCVKVRESGGETGGSRPVIHRLRRMMAEISVGMMNADLVIMDEFQRFPELMRQDEDSETAILARRFLNASGQGDRPVNVLLLSATPYKLYSTLEEIRESGDDEHFREFMQVIRFLFEHQPDVSVGFTKVWEDYSRALHELDGGSFAVLAAAKRRAEDMLYEGIARTERFFIDGADRMLDTKVRRRRLEVTEGDILSYVEADTLLREIGLRQGTPVEYVKSAPFLLSFMERYKLKEYVTDYFRKHPDRLSAARKKTLWVNEKTVANYEKLPETNARMTLLRKEALPKGAEMLLWVPPSRPYYEPGGPFSGMERFSKVLVFSSWEMVPRAIATLVSYEAERRTVGRMAHDSPASDSGQENRGYFPRKNRVRFPAPRLRFAMRDGAPGGMTLFTLVYPCITLARLYDPIDALNRGLDRAEIEAELRERIGKLVEQIPWTPKEHDIGHDERWYSYAPLWLDRDEPTIREWLEQIDLPEESGTRPEDEAEVREEPGAMRKHIEELRRMANPGEAVELGRKPRDLVDVLVHMAMASPAVCALRLFGIDGPRAPALAIRLAKSFVDLFNGQEATAIVEFCYSSRLPHWQNVLHYCVDGNLQSVLDEYAHILAEENGWNRLDRSIRAELMCKRISEALHTHTASYQVDTYPKFRERVLAKGKNNPGRFIRMRSGYAAGFYDTKSGEKSLQRKDQLRLAFNSPFRPFVLATTSIGQEGLDFHFYCRKIVHWNLPANPIDLEQREGRINRFKSLAIRQNIALKYGAPPFRSDIWNEMFERANQAEKKDGQPELVPFWCLPEDVPVKIERIVPMYPFSKDQARYERLMKMLSLYRLSLGQARQEELIEYILRRDLDEKRLKDLCMNLSPYYRR